MERTNPQRRAFGRELTKLLRERYGFLKYPQTYEEFINEDGILYATGSWNGVAIDELKFLSGGVVVATGESTDRAEALFHELMSLWPQIGLVFSNDFIRGVFHVSALIVHSDIDLVLMNSALVDLVAETFQTPACGFSGVNFYRAGNPSDSTIRIERAVDIPLTENQFFAQAPLPTAKHIAFMEKFEQIVRAG
jgi:hypothetical protein